MRENWQQIGGSSWLRQASTARVTASIMQTRDVVEGLHNFRELPAPECLDEAIYKTPKKCSIAFIK